MTASQSATPSLLDFLFHLGRSENIQTACQLADSVFARLIGHKLFTMTILTDDRSRVRRIYSSADSVYAEGGYKPVLDTDWTRQVVDYGIPFLANTPSEMRDFFPDLDQITGMGLGAIINFPVIFQNTVIGTVNILDAEGAYHKRVTDIGVGFAQVLAPVFLDARK